MALIKWEESSSKKKRLLLATGGSKIDQYCNNCCRHCNNSSRCNSVASWNRDTLIIALPLAKSLQKLITPNSSSHSRTRFLFFFLFIALALLIRSKSINASVGNWFCGRLEKITVDFYWKCGEIPTQLSLRLYESEINYILSIWVEYFNGTFYLFSWAWVNGNCSVMFNQRSHFYSSNGSQKVRRRKKNKQITTKQRSKFAVVILTCSKRLNE